jgi:hypothetical protein
MRHQFDLGGGEDLALGQSVIVAARWVLVAAGLVLAVVAPSSVGALRTQVLLVMTLAVCNFALQAQILRRRPTLALLAYAASAADIAIVTALVIADGGYASGLYVFYYPAILALSVAFPLELTVFYATATVAAIAGAAMVTMPANGLQDVLFRCLIVVGVALCGVVYAGIEGRRRQKPFAVEEVSRAAAL